MFILLRLSVCRSRKVESGKNEMLIASGLQNWIDRPIYIQGRRDLQMEIMHLEIFRNIDTSKVPKTSVNYDGNEQKGNP